MKEERGLGVGERHKITELSMNLFFKVRRGRRVGQGAKTTEEGVKENERENERDKK